MGSRTRGAIFVLSVATVALIGVLGFNAIRSPEAAPWPDRVAVIGVEEGGSQQPVRFLAVADPVRRAVVVVPPETVVEVPGTGFLRAYHAYRLGEMSLTRRTLGRLFGVEVPFAVRGEADEFERLARTFTVAEIPSENLDDLTTALAEAADEWRVHELSGERRTGPGGVYIVVGPDSVSEAARMIGGLGTRVFADPATESELAATVPAPDADDEEDEAPSGPAPEEIAVEILNGSDVAGAAGELADRLRELGYEVVRTGDHFPKNVETSSVYFRPGDEEAEGMARQIDHELDYGVETLPEGIAMRDTADVLVLLGYDVGEE